MASESELVTLKEVNEAVLEIVQEGNQDKITTRSVCEDIVKLFGDRLGPLKGRIKAVVRAQLKVLVDSEIIASPAKKKDVTPKNETETGEGKPSEVVENVDSSAEIKGDSMDVGDTSAKKNEGVKVKKVVEEKEDGEDGTEKNEEDAPDDDDDDESKEDMNDTDFKLEKEEEEEEEVKPVKKEVKRERTGKRLSDEVEESESESSEEPVTKRRRRSSTKKKSSSTKIENQFDRYKKLCSQIGCRVPPSRYRGKSTKEKRDIVAEFLLEKGIDVSDRIPRADKLRELKKKLAREKELAELDAGNIIEEGRPRRNAARGVSYSDSYEKEKEVEEEEHEMPPSSPEVQSDSEGYVASIASSEED